MASNLSITDILARRQPTIPTASNLFVYTSISFILWSTVETFLYGRENKSGSGWRLSIFPGYEIDRAAVLQVLSRTNKLVKPITSKK